MLNISIPTICDYGELWGGSSEKLKEFIRVVRTPVQLAFMSLTACSLMEES
jgi:hypothetical protein